MLLCKNALDQCPVRQNVPVQVVIHVVLEFGQVANEIGYLEFDGGALDGIGWKQVSAIVDQVQPIGISVAERSRRARIVIVSQQNLSAKADGMSALGPNQVL